MPAVRPHIKSPLRQLYSMRPDAGAKRRHRERIASAHHRREGALDQDSDSIRDRRECHDTGIERAAPPDG